MIVSELENDLFDRTDQATDVAGADSLIINENHAGMMLARFRKIL